MLSIDMKQGIRQCQKFLGESEDISLLRTLSLKKLPSILGNVIAKIKNIFFEQINHLEAPGIKTNSTGYRKN